jgi:hypothetical protein
VYVCVLLNFEMKLKDRMVIAATHISERATHLTPRAMASKRSRATAMSRFSPFAIVRCFGMSASVRGPKQTRDRALQRNKTRLQGPGHLKRTVRSSPRISLVAHGISVASGTSASVSPLRRRAGVRGVAEADEKGLRESVGGEAVRDAMPLPLLARASSVAAASWSV